LPQPDLFDRVFELLRARFQARDVKFPDACMAATKSRLGDAAGKSIRDSIGPRWRGAGVPKSDIGGTTAIAARQQRSDKEQPEGEQIDP
jgi:hypothetical protein